MRSSGGRRMMEKERFWPGAETHGLSKRPLSPRLPLGEDDGALRQAALGHAASGVHRAGERAKAPDAPADDYRSQATFHVAGGQGCLSHGTSLLNGGAGGPVSRVLYPSAISLRPLRGFLLMGRRAVAIPLAPALPPGSCSQPGGESGAHGPPIWPCSGWGLPAAVSPRSAGSSYLPISPLLRQAEAVCFCGAFRRVTPPGRYPAPCPWELGLSSPIARSGHPAHRPQ